MRVMVLALLLANALFFMWSTWVAEPPVELSPRQVGGEKELTLLAELDNTAGAASTDAEDALVALTDSAGAQAAVEDAADDGTATAELGAALEPMLEVPAEVGVETLTAPVAVVDQRVADAGEVEEPAPVSPPVIAGAGEPEATPAPPDPAPEQVMPAPVEPAEGIQVALADVAERCASLGPFPNLREASEAASRLRANGFEPRQRLAEENVWVGHWVYLPSYPTREEAIGVVEQLREQGVRDIYIEPRGDRENAVSLGLFSDRENAELYAGQVRQYDVRPQITDRYRVGSAYWLDIGLPAGQSPDPAAYQRDEARSLRLEPRECDATRVAERDAGD